MDAPEWATHKITFRNRRTVTEWFLYYNDAQWMHITHTGKYTEATWDKDSMDNYFEQIRYLDFSVEELSIVLENE